MQRGEIETEDGVYIRILGNDIITNDEKQYGEVAGRSKKAIKICYTLSKTILAKREIVSLPNFRFTNQ